MEIFKMLKVAKEMEVDPMFVMNARRRFISSELWEVSDKISEWTSQPWGSAYDVALFIYFMEVTGGYKTRLKKELKAIDRLILEQNQDAITDDMIERARNTPIPQIIELTRGKVRCINPEHEDRNPSASYWAAKNIIRCFVCDKNWDAIDVYRALHGADFREAVKALAA